MACSIVSRVSGRCVRACRACQGGHRLAERGTAVGPGAGLSAIGDRFLPHFAPQGMVRQPFDLLGHPVLGERFERLDQARVQRPPPLLKQRLVGHLLHEGVREGVPDLGEQVSLVEELGALEVRQATVQRGLRQLGHGLKERQGHLVTDDGGGLQEPFRLGSRSMRAARTAATGAGTWRLGSACVRQ